MLDSYRHNLMATMMMATAKRRGEFSFKGNERILYGGAPLPYMTGLIPSLFDEDVKCTWLPDSNAHSDLSFGQRIKKGFAMALSGGVDAFFGIGSALITLRKTFPRAAAAAVAAGAPAPFLRATRCAISAPSTSAAGTGGPSCRVISSRSRHFSTPGRMPSATKTAFLRRGA